MSELTVVEKINAKHAEIVGHACSMIDLGIEIGKELTGAKSQGEHGSWEAWVEENLTFGVRQASKYMYLAKHVDLLPNRTSDSDLVSLDDAVEHIQGLLPPPKKSKTKKAEPRTVEVVVKKSESKKAEPRTVAKAMPADIKAEREKLNRERMEFEQTKQLSSLSDKEVKLIRGCLHPDSVVELDIAQQAKYGHAFDAFTKALQ